MLLGKLVLLHHSSGVLHVSLMVSLVPHINMLIRYNGHSKLLLGVKVWCPVTDCWESTKNLDMALDPPPS